MFCLHCKIWGQYGLSFLVCQARHLDPDQNLECLDPHVLALTHLVMVARFRLQMPREKCLWKNVLTKKDHFRSFCANEVHKCAKSP